MQSTYQNRRRSRQYLNGAATCLDDTQVRNPAYLYSRLEETQIRGRIHAPLKSFQIWQTVRISVIILMGEQPAETVGRQLLRSIFCKFVVVLWVEIPAFNSEGIFHEVDERCAVLINERFSRHQKAN